VREVWLQAHLKQPLGSRDGYRTRQRGGSGLKSSTGGSRSGSSAMARAGGCYIKLQVSDPIESHAPLSQATLRDHSVALSPSCTTAAEPLRRRRWSCSSRPWPSPYSTSTPVNHRSICVADGTAGRRRHCYVRQYRGKLRSSRRVE